MKPTNKIFKALLGGGLIFLLVSLLYLPFVPSALAVTLEPGDLIVVDVNGAFLGPVGSPAGGRVFKVDPDTGTPTIISSGGLLEAPVSIAIDAAGNIIVLNKSWVDPSWQTQIIKVNPADGAQTVISENDLFVNPMGLAIDAAGNIIVADQFYGGTGGIIKVHPTTGDQTVISSGGSINFPSDVTIDGDGNLYVTSGVSGCCLRVVKVNPATGDQTVISEGTFNTWIGGIFIDPAGNIFVTEIYWINGIIKVDPNDVDPITGYYQQSILASGFHFQDPYDVDMDPEGNLVAADSGWWGEGRIIRVDPADGDQTLISSGGLLVDPWGIVVFQEAPVEEQIALLITNLQAIVDSNPGTPLADKIEDALAKAQTVLGELNKTPPDNQAAVGAIEGAVGDLQAAVDAGLLDPAQGTQLMDQFAAIARLLAEEALDQAIALPGDPDVIADAELALAEGDTLRGSGAFKDAVNKYKDALAKAESALA